MKSHNPFLKYLSVSIFVLFFLPSQAQISAIRQLEIISGQRIDRGGGGIDAPTPATPDKAYYDQELKVYYRELSTKENDRGIKAFNNKKWKKAARNFKRAKKLNPKDNTFSANLEMAKDMIRREKEEKADAKRYKKIDKVFLKNINKDIKTENAQIKSLRKSIRSYVPPLTQTKKVIHEGIMLGLFNTQTENDVSQLKSPFTGKGFGDDAVFATSDNTTNMELVRGLMDNNYLGRYTLSTEWGRKLVEKLNGTHFDRLFAHSNGATISEALIREDIITVNELNILGGDRSLINYFGYNELIASGKVKRIVVWVNPGDIIPMGSSAGLLTPTVAEKDEYLKNFAAFINYKLVGSKGGANVEYRYLKGEQYKGQDIVFSKKIFDAHGVVPYFYNLNKNVNP